MNDHERIDEMMAAQALGGLSAADEAELELLRSDHGRDCVECNRLEAEYGEVAGRLAFALDPEPIPPGTADEILERAEKAEPMARSTRPGGGRRLVAAAAAAVLLVAGGVGGYLIGQSTGGTSEVVQSVAQFVSDPSTRVVHFQGTGAGNLSIAFQSGRPSAYLIGSDVPQAPAGKVYELWRFGRSGPPVASGTFEGSGQVVVLPIRADLSKSKMMAVTVERAPGVQQPTRTPIFTAPITS